MATASARCSQPGGQEALRQHQEPRAGRSGSREAAVGQGHGSARVSGRRRPAGHGHAQGHGRAMPDIASRERERPTAPAGPIVMNRQGQRHFGNLYPPSDHPRRTRRRRLQAQTEYPMPIEPTIPTRLRGRAPPAGHRGHPRAARRRYRRVRGDRDPGAGQRQARRHHHRQYRLCRSGGRGQAGRGQCPRRARRAMPARWPRARWPTPRCAASSSASSASPARAKGRCGCRSSPTSASAARARASSSAPTG